MRSTTPCGGHAGSASASQTATRPRSTRKTPFTGAGPGRSLAAGAAGPDPPAGLVDVDGDTVRRNPLPLADPVVRRAFRVAVGPVVLRQLGRAQRHQLRLGCFQILHLEPEVVQARMAAAVTVF